VLVTAEHNITARCESESHGGIRDVLDWPVGWTAAKFPAAARQVTEHGYKQASGRLDAQGAMIVNSYTVLNASRNYHWQAVCYSSGLVTASAAVVAAAAAAAVAAAAVPRHLFAGICQHPPSHTLQHNTLHLPS
jgi:hypothetical protein